MKRTMLGVCVVLATMCAWLALALLAIRADPAQVQAVAVTGLVFAGIGIVLAADR